MNLPLSKKTRKTRVQSTDIDVLNELKGFRSSQSSSPTGRIKNCIPPTSWGCWKTGTARDRVHTSFNQTVTATGRLSSSNPNLQNIPVGETAGLNLRRAFVAAPDMLLLSADYSQIELRVMAHFSGDENLLQAFAEGLDIHQHTADLVFAADLFQRAKNCAGAPRSSIFPSFTAAAPIRWPRNWAWASPRPRNSSTVYFEKYSGVRRFMDGVIADAEKDPEVRTISGRVRPSPKS